MRAIALDHGTARCGVAISDPGGDIVTPVGVVERPDTRRGLRELAEIVRDREAEIVVVGLPLALDGGETAQTSAARAFADRLSAAAGVPVALHDERLTTRLAARVGGDAPEDARAAAHLLESWLAVQRSGAR